MTARSEKGFPCRMLSLSRGRKILRTFGVTANLEDPFKYGAIRSGPAVISPCKCDLRKVANLLSETPRHSVRFSSVDTFMFAASMSLPRPTDESPRCPVRIEASVWIPCVQQVLGRDMEVLLIMAAPEARCSCLLLVMVDSVLLASPVGLFRFS